MKYEVFALSDDCSLFALAAAAACAAAKCLSAEELAVLSAFLCSVGDNLAVIAAKRFLCQNPADT